jgi:hypothetical protein
MGAQLFDDDRSTILFPSLPKWVVATLTSATDLIVDTSSCRSESLHRGLLF